MASSTRQSLASASKALEPLLGKVDLAFAQQLFAVAGAVSNSAQLRNLLSDPSAEAGAKAGAAKAVFGKVIAGDALDFVTSLVALRWSRGSDLVTAIQDLAVTVVANLAAKNGKLEALEGELFTFQQAVEGEAALQFALANQQATIESRTALVNKLLAGNATAEGALLISEALGATKHERYSHVLERFGKIVSAVAKRSVAKVTVASELSSEQQDRLTQALSKQYGVAIKLNLEVDPSIIGGIRVQIADEIIDGSLVSRLQQAKLQLA